MKKIACAIALITSASSVAAAEEPSARALFDAGMSDLRAKRYDRACPTLRKSFRVDAQVETLFAVARCDDEAGRVTTAAAAYDDYLAMHDRLSAGERRPERERVEIAAARRAALEPLIPHVTFRLPASVPEGVRVTRTMRDSSEAVDVALGVPLPIDPGEHYVTTEAPDRPRWEKRFFVHNGERLTVDLAVAPPDTARAARFSKPLAPVPVLLPPLDPGPSAQRIAAYATGGVGIAALVVGAVTGGVVWGQMGTVEANCKKHLCNQVGEAAADTAQTLGVVSTVTFVVGAAGLLTGIILYVTEPGPSRLGALPSRMTLGVNASPAGASMVTTWHW